MYQFSAMFKEINPQVQRPTYRWRGLAAGILGGWLPAWGLAHWMGGGSWVFVGVWILCIPSGYVIGNLFKK